MMTSAQSCLRLFSVVSAVAYQSLRRPFGRPTSSVALLPSNPPRQARCFSPRPFPTPPVAGGWRNFSSSPPCLSNARNEEPKNSGNREDTQNGVNSSSSSGSSRTPTTSTKRKKNKARTASAKQTGRAAGTQQGHTPPDEEGQGTVRAVCTAEGYDMEQVASILRSHGFSIDPDAVDFEPHEVIHARGAGSGDIFVFPSGTVITWGLPDDIGETLATNQLLPASVDPHVARAESEDLEFQTDATKDSSYIRDEVIFLGTKREDQSGERLDTTLAKIAFSSGLARATKLAVLESALTAYFESTRRIPVMLSKNEKVPLGKGFILQKTGELLWLRAQLNHYSELTDSLPDIFWDRRQESGLEGYYDDVGRALDVHIRIRTLNQKMDYAQEIASVLREMSSEKHNTRLEWIIIILIAVEVLFELRRVWRESKEGPDHFVMEHRSNSWGQGQDQTPGPRKGHEGR